MPGFPRTSPCLAPRSHKSSHQPFLCLLFIPLFLPLLIQPSCCPGVLMRSYSNHNSCAHRHTHSHTHSHRAAAKLAFLTLSQPSSPLRPPHSGLADTCYGRGWKPRDYLPESFPCEHVQTMPLFCSGDGGGCLFSVARRRGVGGKKAFPRKQVQAQTPQPHGRPQRRPRRVPCPLPARRTGGISPLTLQSGAEYSCLSPIRPPVSPRSWVPPLLLSLSPLNETLPLYIYLSTASLSNPPRSLSYQCG